MNGAELRAEVLFLVNMDENTPDQSLNTTVVAGQKTRVDKEIQKAYEREWERAKTNANQDWVVARRDGDVWTANTNFHTIPSDIINKQIIDVYDMSSNSEPGIRLVPNSDFTWTGRNEMQWNGTSGPGSDKALRYLYEVMVEVITDDAEPSLIPTQFHQLIILSAGVHLREVMDENVPQSWLEERRELQMDFYKYLSRGRPLSSPPTIKGTDTDSTSQLVT
jgi:hypothetical protein